MTTITKIVTIEGKSPAWTLHKTDQTVRLWAIKGWHIDELSLKNGYATIWFETDYGNEFPTSLKIVQANED